MRKALITLALALTLTLLGLISALGYRYGEAKGKLLKMEEFQEVYMPNPKNVFPNAEGE